MRILNVLVASDPREQQEIAASAGISSGYLSQILKGDRPLTVAALAGLSRALKVDADVLAEEFTKEELIELAKLKGSQDGDRQSKAPVKAFEPAPSGVDPTQIPIPPVRQQPYGGTIRAGKPQPADGEVRAPEKPPKPKK